ncbi:MAG: DUF1614 domain-containing protein [Halobacteriota archaeon]|nr:DUF1614 domain-containing protein [Halobacteriota archaeon]
MNKPDLNTFVFFIFLLIPIFILSYEGRPGDSFGMKPMLLFSLVTAMLLLSTIEVPIYRFRTKKPDYTPRETKMLEEIYSVPIAEELEAGGVAYNSSITLNAGGSILPLIMAIYLIIMNQKLEILVILLIMAVVTHIFSKIKNGVGVVVPSYIGLLVAPIALMLAENAAPIIFITGVGGILLGIVIRLLSIDKNDGSAFFNVGGAGSFNAIYITIILSVLLSIL